MADKYPNFAALARKERAGIDYAVSAQRARPDFALIAPHGGGIEPKHPRSSVPSPPESSLYTPSMD